MKYIPESEFEASVLNAFPLDVQEELVHYLRRGYSTGVDTHIPEEGSNESTFGTCIYECTTFQLTEFIKNSEGLAVLLTRHPSFRMAINGFELSNHRVGAHEGQDINRCYPNKDTPARYARRRVRHPDQLDFLKALGDTQCDADVPCNLVLAHLGNPEQGLCAVYLCRPGRVENGKIVSWDYAQLLWKRDEAASFIADDVQLPAEEIIEEAPVRRKDKKHKALDNGQ